MQTQSPWSDRNFLKSVCTVPLDEPEYKPVCSANVLAVACGCALFTVVAGGLIWIGAAL